MRPSVFLLFIFSVAAALISADIARTFITGLQLYYVLPSRDFDNIHSDVVRSIEDMKKSVYIQIFGNVIWIQTFRSR